MSKVCLPHQRTVSGLAYQYLLAQNSASVWKAARKNVDSDVPECPADQSEPQWANLIFTYDCTVRENINDQHAGLLTLIMLHVGLSKEQGTQA